MRDGGCVADVLVLPRVGKLTNEEDLHISCRRYVGEAEGVWPAFLFDTLEPVPAERCFTVN